MKFSEMEIEKRKRINVALWAYAYEVRNDSIVTDGEFDRVALEINVFARTDNEEMDTFFQWEFSPDTGVWVHQHPNIAGLERIYKSLNREVAV